MLGIGSIIAHSVAIRKPWQRKCRSSSVHRGIAHGKQRVKVCKRKTPHLFLMRSFLSPYGDGTTFKVNDVFTTLFSPPYGDGTARKGLHKGGPEVFAPLRGWYCKLRKTRYSVQVFAPLRGWYYFIRWRKDGKYCFRPLTGMVPSACFWNNRKVGFRPLTGMVRE